MEDALHVQVNTHLSDIRKCHLEKLVAKHCDLPEHSLDYLTILAIEKIYREDTSFWRMKESHWIQTHQLIAPNGLNIHP